MLRPSLLPIALAALALAAPGAVADPDPANNKKALVRVLECDNGETITASFAGLEGSNFNVTTDQRVFVYKWIHIDRPPVTGTATPVNPREFADRVIAKAKVYAGYATSVPVDVTGWEALAALGIPEHAARAYVQAIARVGTIESGCAIDVAYLLATNLRVDDRRTHEQRLLRRYHDRITELGVRQYPLTQFEDDYRGSMLNVTNMFIIAALLDPGNDRGRALIHEIVVRSFTAADDLDAADHIPG